MNICENNSQAVLRAENITKSYQGEDTIKEINISVSEGEAVALLGKSGVGKSTLFNILAGISLPDSGRVLLRGGDITGMPGKVGYMLQNDLLMPYKTVIDNVSLPLLLQGTPKKQARAQAEEYFQMFGLTGYGRMFPGALSGGMRRRAALLRTFLSGCRMILLDEPFSALDSITRGEIWDWYGKVGGEAGFSTLFITHDISEALRRAGRIYIMTGTPGRITAEIKNTSGFSENQIEALLND